MDFFNFLLNPDVQFRFLAGLLVTLKISAAAGMAALLIGFAAAFARLSPNRWLNGVAFAYTEAFRNTPLLIQLYIYYRGLQSIGVMLPPEACGILALSLYTGAYLAEVFRSGVLSIPAEQLNAGLSLGLGRFTTYRQVLVPQSLKIILPAIGNQLISLTKNSSLVAFITVADLFHVVYKGAVDYFRPLEYFLEGSALYLAVSLAIAVMIQGVARLTPGPPPPRNGRGEAYA